MMQAHDVLEVINQLENVDVSVWLDGGWGVDALVGTQTREHSDYRHALSCAMRTVAVLTFIPSFLIMREMVFSSCRMGDYFTIPVTVSREQVK